MTTTAHTVRRLYGGATRQPMPRQREHSMSYKDLMPYMYKNPPKKIYGKLRDVIEAWLAEHGPATARQIADGINHEPRATNAAMRHCKNIKRCGSTPKGAGIWRIETDGISE